MGGCTIDGALITLPTGIFTSSSNTIKNLTINRTNGFAIANQTLKITDVLTLTSGSLSTNGNLILASTSSKTARVAPVTNGFTVTGNVTAERFIPGGSNKRKWRLLSSPINVSGSIALSQFIDDILVTAPAAAGGSFDVSPNNNASIRTYTESTSGASSLGWTNPTNISNTVTTGTGLEVFVRGTRGLANPYLNWTTPDDVTIDFIGSLTTGNITKTLTYTPSVGGATSADGFNLVGNPYASPINFDTTSGWTKTNMENKFWCYNPNTSKYGIYDANVDTGSNGITKYIASGQAFFVRATSASSPAITFTENVKCVQLGNSYFKPVKKTSKYPILRISLVTDSADSDEALIVLDSNSTTNSGDLIDAAKFFNDALNIYTITPQKENLTFNAYPFPKGNDTINLAVWSYDSSNISMKHHKLDFSGIESINADIQIFLYDKYLNTSIDIRANDHYDFMITTDATSYGNDRFKIVFYNIVIGIEKKIEKQNIVLYPNPSKEKIFIQSSDFSENTIEYTILDMMGRTVVKSYMQLQNTIAEIDISSLVNGNYIIRITQNNIITTKKFVKN